FFFSLTQNSQSVNLPFLCCKEKSLPKRKGGTKRKDFFADGQFLLPSRAGAPHCTRVTFFPMRKSPKNLPEGDTPSGYSPWGAIIIPPAARAPLPPEKVQLRAARNQQTTCRATD